MPFEYNNETWRTEGSEYIGLDVTYFIGWSGKIIGWLNDSASQGLRTRYLVEFTNRRLDRMLDFFSRIDPIFNIVIICAIAACLDPSTCV